MCAEEFAKRAKRFMHLEVYLRCLIKHRKAVYLTLKNDIIAIQVLKYSCSENYSDRTLKMQAPVVVMSKYSKYGCQHERTQADF